MIWILSFAHFDHGIRTDSALDNELVENLAKKHGYKFYSKQGKLGAATSEQKAREARYGFLNSVVSSENADGLITAHHQDDLIETSYYKYYSWYWS
ncbi:MAG: ATP-binding protein [Candidatus Saccharibacteria bacterium]